MKRKIAREYLIFGTFVLPLFLPFLIFFIIPAVSGIIYSLFNWNGISSKMTFIGFRNFINLPQDKTYMTSIQFSFRFAVLSVVLGNIISILLALWVNTNIRSSNFIRAAFFMPMVICAVVKGFLWRFIYNQGFAVLYRYIPLPFLNTKILASGGAAFYGILAVSLWGGIGYNMIIYLAGLASIDKTYYESADIDGASHLTKFFRITIPLLMPSITICLFTATASSFGIYDINLALTNGGPGNSTLSMVLDIYNTGFLQNRLGYGSAKAVVLLILIMTITFLQVSATRKREVEL